MSFLPMKKKEISHIGSIILSTTLDTEDKVKAQYGGNTWIQHSGYVLRGATSGVVANRAIKDGGSDDAVVVSHDHTAQYLANTSGPSMGWIGNSGTVNASIRTGTTGESGKNKNIPNYKSVYIWERTA